MNKTRDTNSRSLSAATFLLALALSPLAANAQAGTISLHQVTDAAAAYNPTIKAAEALALAARSRIAGAARLPDPEIQVGVMNRRLPSLAPMEPLGMTQLQIMQMLPSRTKLRLGKQIRTESALAQDERVTVSRWEVRTQAAMSFYDLYVATSQVRIAEENRGLLHDIAKISQGMYAAGEGKQADVLRAQVEVARMNAEIIRMESMRSAAAARLSSITGIETVSFPVSPIFPRLPDSLPPLPVLSARAEANRPMIAAAVHEVGAASASEQLARKELWPDLRVGVQLGFQNGNMGAEPMGSFMVGATLPVYARSRQKSMRAEADAMRSVAVAELYATQAETRARVGEVYAAFASAADLAALYRSTVLPQSQASVAASLSAYRAGTVNIMTVLDNQMTYNRFRMELVAFDADRGKAIAEMEMLLGQSLLASGDSARISQ